jgi:hypothetical protein
MIIFHFISEPFALLFQEIAEFGEAACGDSGKDLIVSFPDVHLLLAHAFHERHGGVFAEQGSQDSGLFRFKKTVPFSYHDGMPDGDGIPSVVLD